MSDTVLPARESLPRKKISELQIGCLAVYYRDGMEMGWVKLDEQHHFPVEINPPKWAPTGTHEPFDPNEEVAVIQDRQNLAGCSFAVEVHKDKPLADVRKEAKEKFGHDVHIRAKIGPIEQHSGGINCPLEAVDDDFFAGKYNKWPQQPDHCLLIGYFK